MRISLERRVSIIEERLGIDPAAVIAEGEAAQARGAEAHELSEPPAVEPDEDEEAL